jgi:hypothetical protein
MTVGTIKFHGIRFRRYPGSRRASDRLYFRPSASHIRRGVKSLHCEIWQSTYGPIPPGWQVHHKDGDALNNDLANLEALPADAHRRHHAEHLSEEARARSRAWVATIRPLAAAWHRTEAGRQWHRQHVQQIWAQRLPQIYTCAHCGRTAQSRDVAKARYCSNACKSAARRRRRVDDLERVCANCGRVFTVNRYAKTQACSRSCAACVRWARRKAD